jgi:hypothetical protein
MADGTNAQCVSLQPRLKLVTIWVRGNGMTAIQIPALYGLLQKHRQEAVNGEILRGPDGACQSVLGTGQLTLAMRRKDSCQRTTGLR